MKQGTFATAALVLLVVVLIGGCIGQEPSTGGMTTKMAVKVFDGARAIGSVSDAEALINQSAPGIAFSQNDPCGAVFQQQTALFQYSSVTYRAHQGDRYWLGYGSNYVATIPLIVQGDVWKYENGKVLIQTNVVNQNAGTVTPTWGDAPYLEYIVDSSGAIYFAGVNAGMYLPERQCV